MCFTVKLYLWFYRSGRGDVILWFLCCTYKLTLFLFLLLIFKGKQGSFQF